MFRPHWVCLAHRCVLSPSTLLRLQAALYGACPALRVVPVFGYSTKARTRLRLRFVPSPAWAAHAARSLTGALSPGAARLLPSPAPASVSARASRVRAPCVLAATLLANVDHPESQEVFGWKPEACLQCGRGCPLWGRICPFPLPSASCLRWGWASPPPASCSLELLTPFVLQKAGSVFGPVNFLLLSPSLSCYLMKAPSNCPQGIQARSWP